jgi:hypothetical protein
VRALGGKLADKIKRTGSGLVSYARKNKVKASLLGAGAVAGVGMAVSGPSAEQRRKYAKKAARAGYRRQSKGR